MKTAWLPISEDLLIRTELLVDALLPSLNDYELILMPAYAGALPAAFAARCGGTAMTLACSAEAAQDGLLVRRKAYGGHIMGEFLLDQPPYFLSLDRSIAEPESILQSEDPIDRIDPAEALAGITAPDPLQGTDRTASELQISDGLTDAKIVVAVGRGMRSKTNVEAAKDFADKLGASLGGSRPVIMNAWLPKEKLIGVSGEMIHPDLCLVLAASGSPAFYAGIEGSKKIIAVNDDPNAPILKKADASVCADWKELTAELLKLL